MTADARTPLRTALMLAASSSALLVTGCFEEAVTPAMTDGAVNQPTTSTADTSATSDANTSANTTVADSTGGSNSSSDGGTTTATGVDSSGGCIPGECLPTSCGLDPICGLPCGTCMAKGPINADHQAAGCLEPSQDETQWYCGARCGFPFALGNIPNINGNQIFGHRVTLNETVTVRALGFLTDGADGMPLRMALYANETGPGIEIGTDGPTTLLAQTELCDVGSGYTDCQIEPTSVEAGDYWVLIHVNDTLAINGVFSNTEELFLFGSPVMFDGRSQFPPDLSGQDPATGPTHNLYLVIEDDVVD